MSIRFCASGCLFYRIDPLFYSLLTRFCMIKPDKCYESLHLSIMRRSDLFVDFMILWEVIHVAIKTKSIMAT